MHLTIDLPEEQVRALEARAHQHGVSTEQYARQVLEHELEPVPSAGDQEADLRPIWEIIADNMKNVPREDLAALPKDGASQIDHYVYGLPKRDL